MRELQKRVKKNAPFDMVVRRAHVLEDALRRANRASFDPSRKIVVSFLLYSLSYIVLCSMLHAVQSGDISSINTLDHS